MDDNKDLIAAIKAKDIEKIKELAQADIEKNYDTQVKWPLSHAFSCALSTASLKVIKTLVDIWTFESPCFWYSYREFSRAITLSELVETKYSSDEEKVSVLEFLLPHFYADEELHENLSVQKMFDFICQCWTTCPLFTKYFLQKYYYSEERNSLYPLIKELQALEVDENHAVSILLHSEIIYLDAIHLYGSLMEFNFKVFVKLILGTAEMMKLAIKILKILLEKEVDEAVEMATKSLWGDEYKDFDEDDADPVSPILLKRSFQLIYSSMNSQNFWKVNSLIKSWFYLCFKRKQVSCLSCQAFVPFVVSIPKLLFPQRREGCHTLKQLCHFCVRNIIAKASKSQPHEAVKRIWSLPLPETVKCEILHLRDASWMNDLNF